MTPQIKTIILSNGEVLSDQGVKRPPKEGEWFLCPNAADGAMISRSKYNAPRTILTPLETQGQKIERRGDWFAMGEEATHVTQLNLNPLIDAACRVVNRPQIALHFPTEAQPLAAALETFTQPVKPKDRYYVESMGGGVFWVCDRHEEAAGRDKFVANCHSEDDAESFAAMKNSQDGGE